MDGGFKSRGERRRQMELVEARKSGLAPPEVDDEGNQINPHIPQFMSSAPWYLNSQRPGLKHQKNWKSDPNHGTTDSWYNRGARTFQAGKFRKGSCANCGAMTHGAKSCTERPRQVGAKWTDRHIAADETVETFELDYDGKRDRWNGYDMSDYALVVERFEARDRARRDYLAGEKLGKLDLEDEAKAAECDQRDFAMIRKRVRTADGGSTGTVRNLRIREDPAKYLYNLDLDSAYYDPKSRSMREDPRLGDDPSQKFYVGDNQNRNSGQASEFNQQIAHACAQDVHMQSTPSHSELLYKNYKAIVDRIKSQKKEAILQRYGNAATVEDIPRELLLGQSQL